MTITWSAAPDSILHLAQQIIGTLSMQSEMDLEI